MRSLVLLLSLTLIPLLFNSAPVKAEIDLEQACVSATSETVDTGLSSAWCDIHTRRINYRENTLQFNREIQDRRANYIAPSLEMRKRYQEEMNAIYARQGDSMDMSDSSSEDALLDFNAFSDEDLSAVMQEFSFEAEN